MCERTMNLVRAEEDVCDESEGGLGEVIERDREV